MGSPASHRLTITSTMPHLSVGICTLTLEIPAAQSLKDKRSILQSLLRRTQRSHNISIAEIDLLDDWNRAVIAFSVVSNSPQHANSVITHVLNSIDKESSDVHIVDEQIEIL